MDLVDPRVERYAEQHTTPEPAYLAGVATWTREHLRMAQMLTGRVEGRLLEALVWATGARRVLELGTYSGYSALAMAAALAPGGRVVTCEVDADHAAVARRHIAASPRPERVEVLEGAALETLASLDGPFDLVFLDADKAAYPDYYEAVLPKLAPRGLLVIDNTLLGGAVLDPASERGRAMDAFNTRLREDARVVAVQLAVRDGVTIVRHAEA